MRIDLDANEAHWLKYCLLVAIGKLSAEDTQLRTIYEGILTKLEGNHCTWFEHTPESGFVLDHAQERGVYRVEPIEP
jgi:hypothetical protein